MVDSGHRLNSCPNPSMPSWDYLLQVKLSEIKLLQNGEYLVKKKCALENKIIFC